MNCDTTCRRSVVWIMSMMFLLASVTSLALGADQPQRTRRVLYNFDGDSCLSTKAGGKGPVAVDVDDVKRLIEEVAYDGSRVDTVLVCINAQVMYYPTKVGTMRGSLSTPDERAKWPASEKQRFENLKAFFDADVDPYAIMLAEAKRRGREALLTFRMNDDHGNDFLRTQFLVDHPDWRLGTEPYRGKGAMDFGRDEVRDYTFRLIEEAVRRYDCDGIELDFNRFPTFFKDGSTDERVAKMNSLVERVRQMLDDVGRERGRRLVLSVRPPSNYGRTPPTPESAQLLGCDVPAWVQSGLVDFVAVSEFLFERGDLPIGLWKQAITTVPVYGGIECTKGGGQKNLTADEYRHAATQLMKTGADGVYLFNFFTSREEGEAAYEPPFEVLRDLEHAPRCHRGPSPLDGEAAAGVVTVDPKRDTPLPSPVRRIRGVVFR
ncbi:MAG: family 10 glycosylhydrolase [Verrucomicrobiales bacterium]